MFASPIARPSSTCGIKRRLFPSSLDLPRRSFSSNFRLLSYSFIGLGQVDRHADENLSVVGKNLRSLGSVSRTRNQLRHEGQRQLPSLGRFDQNSAHHV